MLLAFDEICGVLGDLRIDESLHSWFVLLFDCLSADRLSADIDFLWRPFCLSARLAKLSLALADSLKLAF